MPPLDFDGPATSGVPPFAADGSRTLYLSTLGAVARTSNLECVSLESWAPVKLAGTEWDSILHA